MVSIVVQHSTASTTPPTATASASDTAAASTPTSATQFSTHRLPNPSTGNNGILDHAKHAWTNVILRSQRAHSDTTSTTNETRAAFVSHRWSNGRITHFQSDDQADSFRHQHRATPARNANIIANRLDIQLHQLEATTLSSGRVRTKTTKRASRVLIEKYYPRLSSVDFHQNKRVIDEVAIIPSKRLRNKIAGFTTHLMKRIQRGPVRGISFKLQEEERERKDQYVPEVSALDTSAPGSLEVDPDTKDMLRSFGFDSLPVSVTAPVTAYQAPERRGRHVPGAGRR
ncbi:40S ribosomal protein S17 [Moesziomyces antarcticus T-34]|uniref:40S ribosomal protein S17 n=1 Tax=Pseudozyma antarctica (strain T-34) TaxID=1151754 RepID=M9LUI0_PSEA3|nr:40S ribosomal protein S17 [Moesziomyces antarcticus T-34]